MHHNSISDPDGNRLQYKISTPQGPAQALPVYILSTHQPVLLPDSVNQHPLRYQHRIPRRHRRDGGFPHHREPLFHGLRLHWCKVCAAPQPHYECLLDDRASRLHYPPACLNLPHHQTHNVRLHNPKSLNWLQPPQNVDSFLQSHHKTLLSLVFDDAI